jgi:predicted deacylase
MSTTVFSDIDWDQDGKQVGTLHLPHSPDDDAWGVIPFPAASIKNGQGPVVVVSAPFMAMSTRGLWLSPS